ncbi:MAG: SurA N-terminal domain-containing protein [Parasphingopyxis sp.]|uniref:SurA N-terminal domain-containing protein n=1 Tax=Parasphingopyxis sp. TaxID=1920299 RepID=UPI0032EB9244
MIQFFRNLFSSKIGAVFALLFVVLIFFAFALADINAPGGMFSSSNAIATVGDQEITEEQITDRLNQRLQAIRQQQPGVDMNILVQQGELDNLIDTYARIFAMCSSPRITGSSSPRRLSTRPSHPTPIFAD